MQNKQSVDVSFKELVRQIVLEVLEEHQSNTFPILLTADEIENLTNGKIKREKVYDLARNREKNGFPAIRLGRKDVKVFRHSLIEWLEQGGCPLDNE